MIVVATGADTVNGKTLKELDVQSDDTPLQVKLSNLADRIAKIGLAAAFMMIVLLLITYFSVGGATKSSVDLAADIIEIFINGVTVIVVAGNLY